MNEKKIPLRRCSVSKNKLPKKEMFRIVRDVTGKVFVDLTGKENGRGAYLMKDIDVIKKARLTKQLDRQLEIKVPDSIYNELEVILSDE